MTEVLLAEMVDDEPEPRVTQNGPRPLTDLGNAERLVDDHRADLRYVPRVGWHVWDGLRWGRDEDGELVRRAKATVRGMTAAAAETDDDSGRKKLLGWALRSEAQARLAATITLAESDLRVITSLDELDQDPWLLNVANGIVDLRTGSFRRHDRRALLTKLAPVRYTPDAAASRWHDFLEQIFDGDQELIAFLQRAVGYSLTGSTREQVLFILHGAGANGKSTFLEVLREVFGDYAQQMPAETLLEHRNDRIPNDLARLPGTRFVTAAETGEGRRLNEALVKRMTGGDIMTARFMRAEYFEFPATFKVWLATNHRPDVRETGEAMWRRLRLIPFTVTIPEQQRDPELPTKLRAELPGILAWAIAGAVAWANDGLAPPQAVRDATAAYRSDMDLLGRFLDDRCDINPAQIVKSSVLYHAYEYWAKSEGEHLLSQTAFSNRLRDRGFEKRRRSGGQYWHGVGLTTDGEQ